MFWFWICQWGIDVTFFNTNDYSVHRISCIKICLVCDLYISQSKDILWRLFSLWIKFHVWISFLFQSGCRWNNSYLSFTVFCVVCFSNSNTVIYHTVSNLQGQCKNRRRTTAWQRMIRHVSLPWRHLRQFMRGSLRGGASQIQQTSSTPAATEANRERQERVREGRK